jgi:hypothetical protein
LQPALPFNRSVLESGAGSDGRSSWQSRSVQEYFDTVVTLDETETFVVVKELYFSRWHAFLLLVDTSPEDTRARDRIDGCPQPFTSQLNSLS